MKKIAITLMALAAMGCSDKNKKSDTAIESNNAPAPELSASNSPFSVQDAKANLVFAKNQYLKLIDNVNSQSHLHLSKGCSNDVICFPRAQEGNKIHMEKPKKWTNGFFQGVLWQLLTNKQHIEGFSEAQEKKMYESATYFQDAIFSEAKRTNTHDLGFLLYDSFGEALRYEGLTQQQKNAYSQALDTGRKTLATRYKDEKGLIRSWDFIPRYKASYIENGKQKKSQFNLRSPWQYPVIVDNMMNLEFMLAGDDPRYHEIAYNHALNTFKNHYYYADTDTNKQYPIAYHVFDYGEKKPGNWQGIGNISAWARGQGWSFYGFVTVAQAAEQAGVKAEEYMDYRSFVDTLFGSVTHLMKDDPVPEWDFFASRDDAYKIAANTSKDTAVYSHILSLCDYRLDKSILPYKGWRPIQFDAEILSDESIAALKKVKSIKGEPLIRDGKVFPCGDTPYELDGRTIPKDTSAAALIAAGAYRLAQFTADDIKRKKYIAFGDRIMAELTKNYLTSKSNDESLDLGFVLEEATGNMPSYSEVNTPIVYGDFYFVEANIRKIELAESK